MSDSQLQARYPILYGVVVFVSRLVGIAIRVLIFFYVVLVVTRLLGIQPEYILYLLFG